MNALIKTACEQFEQKLSAAIADATQEELDKKAGLFNMFTNAKKDTFNAKDVEAKRIGVGNAAGLDEARSTKANPFAYPGQPGFGQTVAQAKSPTFGGAGAPGGDNLVQQGGAAIKANNAGNPVSRAEDIEAQ